MTIEADPQFEAIRIQNIVINEVTQPRNDGSRGSALYKVPFQLSARPPRAWAELFVHNWDKPPRWTTRHRPGIASVVGDKIILDGTTVEEVAEIHRETLKLALEVTNQQFVELENRRQAEVDQARKRKEEHERAVREAARKISFD